MSFGALAWASKIRVERPADKLILLAYADRHNEETGCAYPSIAWLSEFSSLDRKTVIASVARLEAGGLLSETAERAGRTGQVKVYRVNVETVPKTEQYQKRNSSVFPKKQSQKRDTEPVKEPILQTSSVGARGAGKGQRLPDGWEPSPLDPDSVSGKIAAAWAPDRYERELSKFSDHWAAKSGKAALSSNWQATWRNWVVKSDEFDQRRNGNSVGPSAAVAQAQKIMARRS